MNRTTTFFLTVLLALVVAGCSSQRAETKAERKPLEKQAREYKTPTTYDHRESGYDRKTGKVLTYDHKPRVELLDEKTGKYAFKWIGYDSKEKTVIFQRGDVIDVVVTATVSRIDTGKYLYSYSVHNLPSSGTYLTTLVIQNFASNVERVYGAILQGGNMSNAIYQFREGNWLAFHDTSDDVQINPGQSVKIQLTSSAPPGLVGCAAVGGPLAIDGAGEEMPSALANLLPGYDEWPSGYTIGPVDRLKSLSDEERIKYLLEQLPMLRKAGWITDDAGVRYEQQLKSNNLDGLVSGLDRDLRAQQITSEVAGLILAAK